MQPILALISWIGGHSTKILGGLVATVSYLNEQGIIPDKQLKYYTAVLAVLTIWRGIFTGNAYNKGVADGLTEPGFSPVIKNAGATSHLLGSSPPSHTPLEPK
jgi:hypothetical protein